MIVTILGGAGFMGAGIVRDMLSTRAIISFETIRLCDAAMEKLQDLTAELADPRLIPTQLDVTDPQALQQVLTGADICINCVPTLLGFQMTIFAAALTARVPYLDLGGLGTYTVKQLEWHEHFRAAGIPAIIGAGADPGMSNVICRAAADRLDEIDAINLYWAAEFTGPENPVLVPPYSVSTVLAEYAYPSTQFYGGQHVTCPPMSGEEILELPAPWGACEFMHSPHSEQLTVPLAEGIREKGIKEFTWKLHLPRREHEAWVGLVKAGFGDFDTPVEINGANIRPLDVLNKIIARSIKANAEKIPAQESYEIHFAIARGRRDGQPRTVRVEVTVSPDPLYAPYVDACTSMNASIATQLLLASPRKPGVFAPESYFDVPAYFAELEKRKFQVSITEV